MTVLQMRYWYCGDCMILSCIDTKEMILGDIDTKEMILGDIDTIDMILDDWHNTGAGPSENLGKFLLYMNIICI